MSSSALTVDVYLSSQDLRAALEDDVRKGLTGDEKSIPPLWFYDEKGSQLFEEITRLPEYYPTRAERHLLTTSADAITDLATADTLVELGAGACDKTRLLLSAMRNRGPLRSYVPFDVSDEFLRTAATGLIEEYEGLQVRAVVGDFQRHLDRIPTQGQRLVAFLGGTIGNFTPELRKRFLFDLNCSMNADDHLLLGTDLVKNTERIVNAYDDAAGVTAEFNKNVLRVINRELSADFAVERFEHVALWNHEQQWIEMRLRSIGEQLVTIKDLELEVAFHDGEDILTEISAKFTPERVKSELLGADFIVDAMWGAQDGEFLLTLAHPYC